jgi:phage N-6-adenine-methyltransferase
MKNQMQLGFSYERLDSETRVVVEQRTEEIRELVRKTAQDIYRIGEKLIQVKDRLPHGQFGSWLEEEFGWSKRTAQQFMSVPRSFKSEKFSDLDAGTSALYKLAAPSAPEEAREEAIERSREGEHISHSDAEDLVEKHESEPEPEQKPPEPSDPSGDGAPPPEPSGLGGTSGEHTGSEEDEPANVHVSNNSGDPEWYTPKKYVEAAREVLGTIELDPASSSRANEYVEAEQFYDEQEDGLKQPWEGRVWMNPPYSAGVVEPFCRKLCGMYERGDVPEAILLVNNATETGWFQHSLKHADAICFPKGRIQYINPDREETNSPLQGQAFLYFGNAPGDFAETFDKFGKILCP